MESFVFYTPHPMLGDEIKEDEMGGDM